MPDFKEYNEEQRKAIFHNTGPALILAGPGSGKTKVITGRVKYLINDIYVKPSSILVITYSKAAALSMQERFFRETGNNNYQVVFGTFHAVFYQILKQFYHFKSDVLLSEKDKINILNKISMIKNMEQEAIYELLHCISLQKNGLEEEKLPLPINITLSQYKTIYSEYREKTNKTGKLDFDDMLLMCKELFEQRRYIKEEWQKRFQYILVDEFQDINKVQYDIILMLSEKTHNLFVVGDDDQSIYGFRGASPGIMKQFTVDYPETSIIRLKINYRSNQEIVDAANKVIADNQNRFKKQIRAVNNNKVQIGEFVRIVQLANHKEEYSYICERIKYLVKANVINQIAVICRTNEEADRYEAILKISKISCYRKKSGISEKHFILNDLIAYFEVINKKVNKSNILVLLNVSGIKIDRIYLNEDYIDLSVIEKRLINNKEEAYIKFSSLNRMLRKLYSMSPYTAITMFRKAMGYEKRLLNKAGENIELFQFWVSILDILTKDAKKYQSIADYLNFLNKKQTAEPYNAHNKGVALLTLHASKGLEYEYVFIPHCNEGNIPQGKALLKELEEEERRLLYVGMTRAKKALEILYVTGTKEHPKPYSRFINKLVNDYSSISSSASSTNSSNS